VASLPYLPIQPFFLALGEAPILIFPFLSLIYQLLKINVWVLGIITFTRLIVGSVSFNHNKNKYAKE